MFLEVSILLNSIDIMKNSNTIYYRQKEKFMRILKNSILAVALLSASNFQALSMNPDEVESGKSPLKNLPVKLPITIPSPYPHLPEMSPSISSLVYTLPPPPIRISGENNCNNYKNLSSLTTPLKIKGDVSLSVENFPSLIQYAPNILNFSSSSRIKYSNKYINLENNNGISTELDVTELNNLLGAMSLKKDFYLSITSNGKNNSQIIIEEIENIIDEIENEDVKVGDVYLNIDKLPRDQAKSLFEALKKGGAEKVTLHFSAKQKKLIKHLPLLIHSNLELIRIISPATRDGASSFLYKRGDFSQLEGFKPVRKEKGENNNNRPIKTFIFEK